MAVVTLDRLSKRYDGGKENAVHEVSLTIADGELMVFLGPSGCGKTTTLRMIAGLESITSGVLSIDGRIVNPVPAKDRDIAMVFQSYALYPHMSVKDNLAFGLKRRSVDRAEIDRRVTDVAATLGLSELLARRPFALSGGQRQRVALGRAIVRDPKVFLFDEPLSNLDAALRASTRQELARLHQRLQATMIYVTHDQVEAMTLGDRICVMNGGRVAQVGTPIEVYQRPANLFVARFLGAPPMNVLKLPIEGQGDARAMRINGAVVPLEAFAPEALAVLGPEALLGFRPETARLKREDGAGVVLDGEARLVERLGAETIVTLALPNGTEVLVRAPGDTALAMGEKAPLSIAAGDLYLFDPVTGEAVARR
ncbi:MAG: sn-glycerol-3-phosphate ABC transporter ATP-binding protein UgpC [Hyphomicrobiaceae bacterium]|jgi:multiple sugar transport system ATP-binding protein